MPRPTERSAAHRRTTSRAPAVKPLRRRLARALDRDAARWVRAFRALGDPTRARVVLALAEEETCVGDLAERLSTTSSVVSHQLRILRDLGLVSCRRSGRSAYYRLHEVSLRRLFEESLARMRVIPATSRPRGR